MSTDTEKEDSSKISRSSSSKSKVVGYSKEFQAMLDSLEEEDSCEVEEDEEGCGTGSLLLQQGVEKKRRLNLGQVKALEKNFEVDNKLEPERKLKLAQELGLQPRQVAIWFQNRRARWKTKQLERDYSTLKSNYDSLKLDYNTLQQHNHSLSLKVKELKSKLGAAEDKAESSQSVKGEEEYHVSESDNTFSLQSTPNLDFSENNSTIKFQTTTTNNNSNSNSNSNDAALMNWIQFSDPRTTPQNEYHHHIVKLEEQPYYCSSLFSSGEESCTNLFSVDQAPSLPWYFSDQ